MKKIIAYSLVIIGCIAICYLVSTFGLRFKGSGNVNPWALTIGILIVAVIMAIVHKIALKHDSKHKSKQ